MREMSGALQRAVVPPVAEAQRDDDEENVEDEHDDAHALGHLPTANGTRVRQGSSRGSSVGWASFKGPRLVQLYRRGFETRHGLGFREKILAALSGDRSHVSGWFRIAAKQGFQEASALAT